MSKNLAIRFGQFFLIVLVLLLCAGCIPYADCGDILLVRGRLVDDESNASVAGVLVGGRTITNGLVTGHYGANDLMSDADGWFVLEFSTGLVPCDPPPEFAQPDQVEIIINREECERTVTIEINEDSAQFVGETIELTEPILVPPCEQSP